MGKSKKKSENYFGEREEQAILLYLSATTQEEKTKIYNEFLLYPFHKLVESIIWTYKLCSKENSYDDVYHDCLSNLVTKLNKFKPNKIGKTGKPVKAYSYFGTIVKRYLIRNLQDERKNVLRNTSYDDLLTSSSDEINGNYVIDEYHEIDGKKTDLADEVFFESLIEGLKKTIRENHKLKESDILIGKTLVELLENWKVIFGDTNGTIKFHKNLILGGNNPFISCLAKKVFTLPVSLIAT